MDYRRYYQAGGSYFFTVVTHNRRPILTTEENIQRLRKAFRHVQAKHPFHIDAIVVLPDHLHTLWRLPEGDADFSTRWRKIKHFFSIGVAKGVVSNSKQRRREKGVWQRRFWEHALRDEHDWRRHVDYIHYNPVKHGHVSLPAQWPFSSFHKAVKMGWYEMDWGASEPDMIRGMEME